MKTNQYSIIIEDIVALAEFDFDQSHSRLRYLQWQRILTSISLLIILALISWIAKSYTYIILGVPVSFVFFMYYPKRMRSIFINSIQKTYLEGENKNTFSSRTIEILPDKIIVNTEFSESLISWKSIEKLLANNEYIYIYTSTATALIIPKSAIPVEVAQDFFPQAKKYYEESKKENG